jgi:hypothetical protein
MENIVHEWQRDWKAFVSKAAELIDGDCDDEALTQCFQKKPICWVGRVHAKLLKSDLPGVQFTMPNIQVKLRSGKVLEIGFLFASFNPGEVDIWQEIDVGAVVRFATEIAPGEGPFGGVECDDLGNGSCTLSLNLKGVRPCEVQQRNPPR